MTAHDVSNLNHDGLQYDNLCAVTDRAYRGNRFDAEISYPSKEG